MPLLRRNLTISLTMKVNIHREYLKPKGSTCHIHSFPFPFKSKESLDLGIHGDMEEGIFKIQPLIHDTMLEPIPDSSDILHFEVNMMNELVEFLQIQDRSPLVRTPFRFRYSEV